MDNNTAIYQLNDLIEDRKSFLSDDEDCNEIFLEDIAALEAGVNALEENEQLKSELLPCKLEEELYAVIPCGRIMKTVAELREIGFRDEKCRFISQCTNSRCDFKKYSLFRVKVEGIGLQGDNRLIFVYNVCPGFNFSDFGTTLFYLSERDKAEKALIATKYAETEDKPNEL